MAKKSPPVRAADVLLPLANVMPELGSKYQPNHLLRQKNRSINASAPQVLGCSPGRVVWAQVGASPGISSTVLESRKGILNGRSSFQFVAPWLLYVVAPNSTSNQFSIGSNSIPTTGPRCEVRSDISRSPSAPSSRTATWPCSAPSSVAASVGAIGSNAQTTSDRATTVMKGYLHIVRSPQETDLSSKVWAHKSPLSAKLRISPPATIKWSRTRMSTSCRASRRRRAMSSSAWLGSATPGGDYGPASPRRHCAVGLP